MRSCIAVLLLVTLVSFARAEEWTGTCDVRFLATSTLHDFSGTVRCQPFKMGVEAGAAGRPVIPAAEIAVLVDEISTANGDRDEQMRKMFQSGKFPRILGRLSNLDADGIRREARELPNGRGTVEFTLKIRETERRVRAVIGNLRERPGRVTFDAEFPLSLKEFDLKPPTVLFRLIRVGDKVTVKAAFQLEAMPPK